MSSERYARVKELFVAARQQSPEQRRALLDRACAGDVDLRREVERLLLRHDGTSTGFLDQSPKLGPVIGSHMGPYQLLKLLGEGGMGLVYLAEQERPIRRRVALKLIKWGMDTVAVLARFDAERQALAMMDHPHIASVFDVGAAEDGRPYFVMELVQGIPITEYCDSHQLSVPERLAVFVQVCHGVRHAHQKGIIHRDLKPSNVLVTVVDAEPVTKIIDFGVAKAIAQRLTEHTVFTELGQWIGTPEYMSPEQAEMSGQDIDTRSDVYSLGVILYELLVGTHPLDVKELRNSGFDEMRRKIREDEPARPSARLTRLGDTSAEAARNRRMTLPVLRRQLRGDLDWITMKALEKGRSRRYGSASELSADIGRHLRHEPVLAGPPSRRYRVGKFTRRHRVGVTAGAALTLAMLLGITGTTIGLIRTQRAQTLAAEEAETATQVSEFLVGLFKVSDPSEARGNSITAREILDRGAEEIERKLGSQPLVRGRLMSTMGQVYQNLGLYEPAEPLLRQGLTAREQTLGDEHPAVAESLHQLSWLHRLQGRPAEAVPLSQRALAMREQTLGADHPAVAWSLHTLGVLHRDQGAYPVAKQYLERALEIRTKVLGPGHLDTARNLYQLGWLLKLTGEYERAKAVYERALPVMETELGADSPELAWCHNDLGVVFMDTGDNAAARSRFERAVSVMESVLGPQHPYLTAPLNNLGVLLYHLAEYEAARPHYERALEIREKALGSEHPDVAGAMLNLALVDRATGSYGNANGLLSRALSIWEKSYGSEHPRVANCRIEMAILYAIQGRQADAESFYRRSIDPLEKALGPDHPELAISQAFYWAAAGKRDEALRHLRHALDLGYSRPFHREPLFASLRGDPEYEALVDEATKDGP